MTIFSAPRTENSLETAVTGLHPTAAGGVKINTSRSALIITLITTTIACAWLCWSTVRIEKLWLQNFGFFFDPASYYVLNIVTYDKFVKLGAMPAAISEIFTNYRCPARTIPYLLLCPKLLTTLMGHMWTEMPLVWGFLTLFCTTVFKRTQSLLLALAATATFVALPLLYNPFYGLAAYWLDIPAACALGLAALSLIRYVEGNRHPGWMIAFGACASLTALCRWSAAFYALAFFSLAVPVAFFGKPTRSNLKTGAIATACALLTAAPGIAFTLNYFSFNVGYYKTVGYAFGSTVAQSIQWTSFALREMISPTLLGVFGALFLINLWNLRKSPAAAKRIAFISLWFPVSMLLFICLIVKAVDGYHPLVYIAPALMVAAFCPLQRIPQRFLDGNIAAWCLLTISLATTLHSYQIHLNMAEKLHAGARLDRILDKQIADEIAATGCKRYAQFDAERVQPSMELYFYRNIRCDFHPFFSIHEQYMKDMYRNQSPEEMGKTVYAKAKTAEELVVVFANPDDARKPGVFDNKYSIEVARYVSALVQQDPIWEFRKTVAGPRGKLRMYLNRNLKKATKSGAASKQGNN